jgi:anti-anti-sigma regulatory factor
VSSELPARDTGFSEVVDRRTGAIRADGHLTEQGADLLRGAVLVLHRQGHDRVTLDLEGVLAVDDAGLRALRSLQDAVAADGRELVVVHPPASRPGERP